MYIITGRYYNSTKRFHLETSSFYHAMGINLWRGSVWQVIDGKRHLIKRVTG